jgi:NAD(P)-dependent dehydrogenase (short-subunit alcohol dehydrogenase family)
MGKLTGKYAVITGGGKGIGRACGEKFLAEGAAGVTILDYDRELAENAAQNLPSATGKVIGIQCDVCNDEQVKNAISQVLRTFGRIDILVNNAGMAEIHAIDTTTDELWDRVIATNQSSVFYYCREAVKHFMTKMEGCIVNVSSTNGLRPLTGFAYSVSKFEANAITRSVALRFAGTKICCNALCPGGTNTPMMANNYDNTHSEKDENAMEILKRRNDFTIPWSDPIEQAGIILFLASDAASSITGAIVEADKGSFIRKSGLIPHRTFGSRSAPAQRPQRLQKFDTSPRRCRAAHKSFF